MTELRVQLGAHPVAYPVVRGLARFGPVVRVPRVGVMVNDAALVRQVLGDPERFTKTGPGSPADLWTPVVGPRVLLNMEGAAHTELRRKLAPLFTPRAVAALCESVAAQQMCDLTEALTRGGRVDLVTQTRRLAGAVIAELVGLPGASEKAFAAATAVTGLIRLTRPRLTAAQIAHGCRAMATLTGPAARAYATGDPATVPGRMRELGLSEQEALGAVAAFALTGTETLVSFVPRLAALLIDHGRLTDADDAAITEALRVTVPSPVMLRSVAAPGRIGTVTVTPGDRVVLATLNAARAGGHRFAPEQGQAAELRNLWFGAGPHFCLGMPLAMAEIHTVLAALQAAPPLRIVRRRVARRVLIPAYAELVVQV